MSDIEEATRPEHYGRPLPSTVPSVRTRDHRCGKCAWNGTGRVDCPNNKEAEDAARY